MKKWQYLIARQMKFDEFRCLGDEYEDTPRKSLNALGSQGWELVSVKVDVFYFKRPLPLIRVSSPNFEIGRKAANSIQGDAA